MSAKEEEDLPVMWISSGCQCKIPDLSVYFMRKNEYWRFDVQEQKLYKDSKLVKDYKEKKDDKISRRND